MKLLIFLSLLFTALFADSAQEAGKLVEQGWGLISSIADQGFGVWIKSNILVFVSFIVGIAAFVASLTPNESDNKVINSILSFINVLGLNIGKAKNDPKA